MKESKKKRALFITMMALLSMPAVMQLTGNALDIKLYGAAANPSAPVFSDTAWFSGNYQKKAETYFNSNFGFRNFVIRLHHQLAYSLFGKVYARNVIIGKEDYLFEEPYIHAYYGDDYLGEAEIRSKLKRVKKLQSLLQEQGKFFLVVYAPGKAAFCPEFIPDSFKHERGPTNIASFVKISEELGINHIDMHSWFVKMHAEQSPYPLYSKMGTHWTHYGAFLAMDSLQGYLSQLTKMDLPRVCWDKIVMRKKLRDTDQDIGLGLNLLFPYRREILAYPEVHYSKLPNLFLDPLFVADSYFWVMYHNGYLRRIYPHGQFAYVSKEVWPEKVIFDEKRDLAKFLYRKNVFVVLCTDASLKNFGWGFIESSLNQMLDPRFNPNTREAIDKEIQKMKSDPKFLEYLQKKAADQHEPLDSVILKDAIWLYSSGG